MALWMNEETFKLIELWSQEDIQAQLEGCKRNQQVYEKISVLMQKEGFSRTYKQCREKVKKLCQQHKKVRDKMHQAGQQGRQHLILKFVFFDAVVHILGNRSATEPKVIIDSMGSKADEDDNNASGSDEDGNEEQQTGDKVDDSTEFENSITENDDNVSSKDLVIVKEEDEVDVKPIVTCKKK